MAPQTSNLVSDLDLHALTHAYAVNPSLLFCEQVVSCLKELQARRVEVEKYKAWAASCDQTPPETSAPRSFQDRVFDWARDCFGEEDTADREMRTFRFLEEALELAQACGCPRYSAQHVLDYVYGRPPGEVSQEAGGTMVSLAVLCQAFGIGMNRCAEAELTRVLGKVEQIRARHAAKPDFAVKAAAKRCQSCGDGCSGCEYCLRGSDAPPEQVKTGEQG